jgi:hypothetical protein
MPLLLLIVVHRNSGNLTVLHGRSRFILYHPRADLRHTFLRMYRHCLHVPLTIHLCSSTTPAMCLRLRCQYLYFQLEGSLYLKHNPKLRHLNLLRLPLAESPRRARLTSFLLFPRKRKIPCLRESLVICQLSCARVDAQLFQRGVMEPPPGIMKA